MLRAEEVKPTVPKASKTDLERMDDRSDNMLAGSDGVPKKKVEGSPDNPAVKLEKLDVKKVDKKSTEADDPKPRIVLTFRSEKSGTKSSNMKIVTNEEKQEVSPRRSNRSRVQIKYDSDEEFEAGVSPKKEKGASRPMSENDDASDSSHTTPKRSTRRRSKEFSDSILANAIARKEKSYNDATPTSGPQRPSRRIKPTPKVLANKELSWLQSQPYPQELPERSEEEGIMMRRSARLREKKVEESYEEVEDGVEEVEEADEEVEAELEDDEGAGNEHSLNNVKKLKHLCELGLRAINPEAMDEDGQDCELREEEMEADEDEELDEDLMNIAEVESSDLDTEFYCSTEAPLSERPRRSTRLCSMYGADSEDAVSPTPDVDATTPVGGDEGSEATCPEEESGVIAQCFCEAPSTIYASEKDLEEPVFCQAIDVVDGVRVGCSHGAARDETGAYAALLRSGPRAPYFLACETHEGYLREHMCCPTCGMFCSQGSFYRCSQNHFFHLECGIPCEGKRPGCPHCGVYSYRWQPANKACRRVHVTMLCSTKKVYLPSQRLQRTPAYLGFASMAPSLIETSPVVPPALLPSIPVSIMQSEVSTAQTTDARTLYEAISAGATPDSLLPLIVSCPDINKPVTSNGGSCLHAAAKHGHLAALYLCHYAGGNIDAVDRGGATPLMRCIAALTKKSHTKAKFAQDSEEEDDRTSERDDLASEGDSATEEEHLKVIRYLVAAGCDVNFPGPDGMTALHSAAQYGHVAACAAILESARTCVDARDHGGWTPLVWAAEHSHAPAVKLLLSHGADPTATDIEGNAACHWCALEGGAEALRLLVSAAPAAAHAVNAHRDTPLHVAARQGHYACVVILLAHGARTDVENSAGELPAEVCGGECQAAIALNMQVAMSRAPGPRFKLLSSDISNGREAHPIPCINEVDDAPLPDDFVYVTRHVTVRHVTLDDTLQSLQGCVCTDGTCTSNECSCVTLGVRRWFQRGRLAPDFPYHEPPMLFQCNMACSCNAKLCTNAVVTRACANGSMLIRACVYRAGGAKGWGLRAMAAVPRGSPVATYCGELLAMADADTRTEDHYMFALEVKSDLLEQCTYKEQLCVDAAQFGSAARFINHSCAPNLAPVRVFTCGRDLRLPQVALFAAKDIAAGDELTFDYGDKFWSVKSKWMKCECGAADCRYPTQTSDDADSQS